ncbi:MAG: tRNA epoxyqueuosine(34) reductase QueG [Candidatus Eisenbacteria bacterium]|uniref:Epoxyqueuosine reductase n=1 Tax=Eiseniibacteriota bacterium TaxID=2212470 RepID=A0A849SGA7_UNCEI|nr:tRNA epoxyqueuosine(34) reductase QueG [Candidatus Eisenbacteria bacterium]
MSDAATVELARDRTAKLKEEATRLGFEAAGVASFGPLDAQAHYEAWLAAGMHGGMEYLASPKHRARRADPTRLLSALRSVLVVAMCYPPERDAARDRRLGRIARYAAGEDYHRVMRDRLRQLEDFTRALVPGSRALWYSDTGAILERGWAERAGIGWVGKHAGVLSESLGSWFLLGEVLIDYELVEDSPVARERCGTCTRCLEACPTGAIVAPHRVDARRCISYLTIEHRGAIPLDMRAAIGDWVFGCDVCQEVCPWNRFAPPAAEARLHARSLEGWSLTKFLSLDEARFLELFETSPIRRATRAGFLRNVCVALGNRRETTAVPALLATLARDPDALVRAHAAWALGEIAAGAPQSNAVQPLQLLERIAPELSRAATADRDTEVREEARIAHARAIAPS